MDISYIVNHLGEERANYSQAVAPPVFQTSNFAYPDVAALRRAFAEEYERPLYTRGNNPTTALLRLKLAALEGAEDALVFGSGAAAMANAVLSQVQAGDHIVCVEKPYSWTGKLLKELLARFGVEHSFIDARSIEAIRQALRPQTRMLVLESPNTMTYELQDLAACAALARERGIVTLIDNSYCTPLIQRPIELGIDMVAYSGTKYYNGHSDVVVGVLCGSRERLRRIFERDFMTLGAILSPHDAWLTLRGLRTYALRLERSAATALHLAAWLEGQPQVERVLYPGLPSFPQYDLACRQMGGKGSGLFSVYFRARSREQMERFCDRLASVFLLVVSWGGYESLMMPACVWHNSEGAGTHLPFGFVRFYAGLEEPAFLQEALQQAIIAELS